MFHFEYHTPTTIPEAVALLSRDGAMPLAGGTDLMIHIRAGKSPKHLVDLDHLGLKYVRQEDGVIYIGAMTTFAELLESEPAARGLRCLAESAESIGAVQTRHLATIGGNLCSAVPSADSAAPLLVLDARVKLAGRGGGRLVPLDQFFTGPKKSILQPAEILAEIQVPVPPARTGTRFLKVGRRRAMTLAVVNVAALLTLDEHVITTARIALGAVAPVPLRATNAEAMLHGCEPSEALFERAAMVAAGETAPIGDLRATAAYRREVSRVLVKRALMDAWQFTSQSSLKSSRVPAAPGNSEELGRTRGNLGQIDLSVNGQLMQVIVKPQDLLVDVLRDQLGLIGTKKGCGTGECGACTVLLDGHPVNSCLVPAVRAHGKEISTIEGLGTPENLHPLQESFIEHGAVQCGFCAPGMLLSAKALLDENPHPTDLEIREAIVGNLCRCTGYAKIVEAIKAVADLTDLSPNPSPLGEGKGVGS